MFKVISNFTVIVSIKWQQFIAVFIINSFHYQRFILFIEPFVNFLQQCNGKSFLCFNFPVAFSLLIINDAGFVSLFKTAKHFNDVPYMLTNGSIGKYFTGINILTVAQQLKRS